MAKFRSKFDKKFLRKKKDFEDREVFKGNSLRKQIEPSGYEAFRVSPQTTTKFGMKYRKVFGASISPDFSRPTKKKHTYGARVEWHPHGFTSAKAKPGTRLLAGLKSYPVDQKEARMKLMIKKRK